MKTMKTHFKKVCSQFVKSKKCNSCILSKKKHRAVAKKMISAAKQNKKYVLDSKEQQEMDDIQEKCDKCKATGTKPCNLHEYKVYSGAISCNKPLPQE